MTTSMASALSPAIEAEELLWDLPGSGRVLCYHRPGQGRPLLLLHSINAAPSAYEVSPFFTRMKLKRPLYAPDLPGFGRSNREDRRYSPEFFAGAIREVIAAIGPDPVDVVALSTTAEFTALAAAHHPDCFNKLVFVSPTGFSRRKPRRSADQGAAGDNSKFLKFLRLPMVGTGLFRALRSRKSVSFFLNMAFKEHAPVEMVDYALATAAQPGAQFAPFYFLSGQLFSPDAIGELYSQIQQETLVLYDKDPNVGLGLLDDFVNASQNWHAHRVPETLGLPHFEKPAETERALLNFL
ncbi:MAG: alpha/beta hydrolase [Pseudomonadota bacterium]